MTLQTLIQGAAVLELIPQRPPMVMIDKFFGIRGDVSTAGLTVTADNLFVADGCLSESGLIEHIAQSAAARIGYIYTQQGLPVPLGFIGSVDKLRIDALPSVGSELCTQISIVQEVGDITLIAAEVRCGDQLIAHCKMKIFLNK